MEEQRELADWMGQAEAESLRDRILQEGKRFDIQARVLQGGQHGTWIVETSWDQVPARHATPTQWEQYFSKTNTWKEERHQQGEMLMEQWRLYKAGGGRRLRSVSSKPPANPVRRFAPPMPSNSPSFFSVSSLAQQSVAHLSERVQLQPSDVPSEFPAPMYNAEICPLCKGSGHRKADVPFGHPLFGKAVSCLCLKKQRRKKRFDEMLSLCEKAGFERGKILKSFRFQVPGVQPAYRATKQFMSRLEEWAMTREWARGEGFPPDPLPDYWLILAGPPGTGKSHLLMAIGNAALDEDIPTIFSPVPDLLDYLRATFAPESETSYDAFFDRLKNVEVLLLDDLGAEYTTPWVSEKLFQLLNYRYECRLPTVISLNSHIWQYLDIRLQSRFRDIGLVEFVSLDEAQDYRLRQGKVVPSESSEL